MPQTQLLDLKTATEQYTVRIDDQPYDLRSVDRLSLTDSLTFQKLAPRFSTLVVKKAPSVAEATELETLLDEVCRVVLAAPAEVHQRLSTAQRLQICGALMALPSGTSSARRRTPKRASAK